MTRAATVCIVKREAPLYTSILGSRSIAAAIVLMVTSPYPSAAVLGACPWIASRMRVAIPASIPTVLKWCRHPCMSIYCISTYNLSKETAKII